MIAIQAVLIIGILAYIVPGRYRLYDIILYDASENVPPNPLIGYAPPAEKMEDCENTSLVFIMLPFSELEPKEGFFDLDGIGKKYHFDEYRAAGKNGILRLVCDVPGSSPHMDIPDWLYQKTGDGKEYSDSSGSGYAPDYSNSLFLEEHKKALQVLSRWCSEDSFIAYVEIGSTGQNGLWSACAPSAEELRPSGSLLSEYAAQYVEAFPEESGIRLLSGALSEYLPGTGGWSDDIGNLSESKTWIRWIGEEGDVPENKTGGQAQNGETAGIDGFKEENEEEITSLWSKGPVGGGLTKEIPMEELLMSRLSDTLGQLRNAHVSFIGPLCPDAEHQDTNGSSMILRDVGYCIYLSRLQTTVDFIDDNLLLHFTFSNIGNAPLYWDWPVTMYIYDRKGVCVREEQLDISLSELLPGKPITVTGFVPYSRVLIKGYSVGLKISSPDGKNHITLAQKGVIPDQQGIHKVYRFGRR